MKNSRILKWVLIVSIVIVLNLFFNVATRLAYPEPEMDKYCPQSQVNITPDNQAACVAAGGAWNGPTVSGPVNGPDKPVGYCDATYTCRQNYDDAHKVYNRNVFVVMVVLGLLSIGAGFATAGASAVSTGLSFGGVMSLIIGSIRYWSDMQEYLRLIILGLALATLLWLGFKKIKE